MLTEESLSCITCRFCRKVFKKPLTLATHLRKFHVESAQAQTLLYPCQQCGKIYKHAASLLSHTYVHKKENEHICTINDCQRKFQSPKRLAEHLQRAHAPNAKQFICEYCGYRTRVRSNLVVHKRQHTGERPFCCEQCGKRFSARSALTQHRSVHAERRTFKCQICGLAFLSQQALSHHKALHLEKKRFVCPLCNSAFAQAAGRSQHMRRHRVHLERTTEPIEILEYNNLQEEDDFLCV